MRGAVAGAEMERAGPECRIAGLRVTLDCSGAAFLPEERMLLVADLHLEKSAAFARFGQMLPPYDSLATLQRLEAAVHRLQPESLVLLGDSLHRADLGLEAGSTAGMILARLAEQVRFTWITGNHDPHHPADLPGESVAHLDLGGVRLRHAPEADGRPEIVGHLHPAARLVTRAGMQRRRCFLASGERLLMPAFGCLTGALDVTDRPIRDLGWGKEARAYLLAREAIHAVPFHALAVRR
ncbi:MAG: ligase-associated DNA damage response endonuclease PdeM [Methylobacterium sp.]|nr:ligase-associated DNA damage response endonuclease PdeM [Methylobacterium sp.]MCA3600862.1 ligase-associated DNA damage response endonuclease PdeM [Methylobacterium sp.]MCA3603409.1 ligase-associated DNA damage response endonuclease PdeM [Methylobacterium sp.]MCA3615094.1 ligase-associated DNA damage response endonuclease PdeM [Methylobacterium sp.]MCA3626794.1 ligase-associated DNA damage response endonuclease PdeM [Methylobacterium sp.]